MALNFIHFKNMYDISALLMIKECKSENSFIENSIKYNSNKISF